MVSPLTLDITSLFTVNNIERNSEITKIEYARGKTLQSTRVKKKMIRLWTFTTLYLCRSQNGYHIMTSRKNYCSSETKYYIQLPIEHFKFNILITWTTVTFFFLQIIRFRFYFFTVFVDRTSSISPTQSVLSVYKLIVIHKVIYIYYLICGHWDR